MKVLIFTTRQLCYNSGYYFAHRIGEELEKLGIECEYCEIPEYAIPSAGTQIAQPAIENAGKSVDEEAEKMLESYIGKEYLAILDFNSKLPRLILDDESYYLDSIDAPFYNFILDHPLYHHSTLDCKLKNYYAFSIDENHCKYIQNFYPHIKAVYQVALGAENVISLENLQEKKKSILIMVTYRNPDIYMKQIYNMNKYAEVIVTYNRKKLLKENIEALLNQTFKDHDILIVDNNSNDGTKEMVAEIQDKRIKYYNTGKNLGGAGGFAFGLRKAIELGYLYAWIMDDDSIPEKEALQSLVDKGQALDGEFSYLASLVYWTDGKLFDMNVPDFQYNSRLGLDLDRIRKNKLLLIDTCSFVGCFINLKYAETAGLPISEFFIYGDDQEYTARLRKLAPAYLDFDSVIVHKAPSNKGADVVSADETRIERFFYQARNGMYIARKNGKVGRRLRVIGGRIKNILRKAPDHKAKRVWVTCKGTISGFFFNPKIEYAHRKGE